VPTRSTQPPTRAFLGVFRIRKAQKIAIFRIFGKVVPFGSNPQKGQFCKLSEFKKLKKSAIFGIFGKVVPFGPNPKKSTFGSVLISKSSELFLVVLGGRNFYGRSQGGGENFYGRSQGGEKTFL